MQRRRCTWRFYPGASDSGRFGCRQRIHVNRDHASRSGVLRVSGMCIQQEYDVKCCDSSNSDSLSPMILSELKRLSFLADRTTYNGITQVWEVLEWRQSAANRKVQPAGGLQPTPPLWCTCPSRSWSQLCCLVGRGTCVWTTYLRLLRGMPRPGIELATFRSRVASANHWATAPKIVGVTICIVWRYVLWLNGAS